MSARPGVPPAVDGPAGMERVCAFTLVTALAWLGHECPGDCPTLAATMRARTWFARRTSERDADVAGVMSTLVVVDLSSECSDPAAVRQMLRQVNACAGRDHIQVRERARIDPRARP